jgi:arsenate reductase
MPEPIRVLFLCQHNTARSQIAEAMLRQMGGADFAAFSAGTDVPAGSVVHPQALELMREYEIPTDGLTPKHHETFGDQSFDFIITLYDPKTEAPLEHPGDAQRIRWTMPDPVSNEGTDDQRRQAFGTVRVVLLRRLPLFIEAQRTARERGQTSAN